MSGGERDEFLTAAEVARWLNLSPYTVLRAARAGELPGGRKIRNSWRFSRRAVEAWFTPGRGTAAADPGGQRRRDGTPEQ